MVKKVLEFMDANEDVLLAIDLYGVESCIDLTYMQLVNHTYRFIPTGSL